MIEEKPVHPKAAVDHYRKHYAAMEIEPFAAMESWLTTEQMIGFFAGNVIKYVARYNANAPGKGGLPDLVKARDYLDRLIKVEEKE